MERLSTTMKRYPGSVSSAAPSKKSRCPVLSKKTDPVMSAPIGIFTVFTDTTSKITNFQPASRKQGNDLLPLIVILPTFDYHAKLTRKDASSLPKLFENDPLDEESRLVMLALMGLRLALQTGSFTALLPEMVASHLMVSLRVGDDHEPLEAFYPSEPILAEASSNITARYGWTRPCQAMVPLFRHGMVEKGFREEYITKTLCCIAFEDACRELKEKAGQREGSEEIILWYSRPVPVFLFLDRLLQNPLRKVEIDSELLTDDDDVEDNGGSSTSILSSTPEEAISPISGRRNSRRLAPIPKDRSRRAIILPGNVNVSVTTPTRESKMHLSKGKGRPAGQKPVKPTSRAKPTYDDPICEPTDEFFDGWDSDEDFPYLEGVARRP
jgi:hypothetical protein